MCVTIPNCREKTTLNTRFAVKNHLAIVYLIDSGGAFLSYINDNMMTYQSFGFFMDSQHLLSLDNVDDLHSWQEDDFWNTDDIISQLC